MNRNAGKKHGGDDLLRENSHAVRQKKKHSPFRTVGGPREGWGGGGEREGVTKKHKRKKSKENPGTEDAHV